MRKVSIMQMGVRKINRVGNSTLTVSLPHSWANVHNLKFGDEVIVEEKASFLTISPKAATPQPKKASIHLKKGVVFRRRYFAMMYKNGCDEIEVTSEDPLDTARVHQAMNRMLGFELQEATPTRVVVRNVAIPKEDEFNNIFHRLFEIVVCMSKLVLQDMGKRQVHLEQLRTFENDTNKYSNFCHRLLVSKDQDNNKLISFCQYHLSSELEQIADHLQRLGYALKKGKVSSSVIAVFEQCCSLIEQLHNDFNKVDTSSMTRLVHKMSDVFDGVYSLFHSKDMTGIDNECAGLMVAVLGHVKEISTQMYYGEADGAEKN